MTDLPFLPYGKPTIDDADIAAVVEAMRSPMLTTGPQVPAFEAALASVLDVPETVAVSNGTAALHCAAMALDLAPGDCVIVPSITFLATANASVYCGARVVFADVDPDTGLLTADTAAAAIDRAPGPVRAIFPVHLNGQSCDMPALAKLARARQIAVVEDACHAVGGTQFDGERETPVGACTHSDMATFSFHPVKTITTLEGGAISTRNPAMAQKLRDLRNHGLIRDVDRLADADLSRDGDGIANPWAYEMPQPGYNYRLTDVQCALGRTQLAKLDGFVRTRRRLVAQYRDTISRRNLPIRPVPEIGTGRTSWHLFAVQVDFGAHGTERARVMRAMAADGVGSQVHYIPVHRQPYYRTASPTPDLPGAESYYAGCLSLPLYPEMTESDIDRVLDALAGALGV